MSRYFTHFWSNDTIKNHKDWEGLPLDHTAGDDFLTRGVKTGDIVYIVPRRGCGDLAGRPSRVKLRFRSRYRSILYAHELEPAHPRRHHKNAAFSRKRPDDRADLQISQLSRQSVLCGRARANCSIGGPTRYLPARVRAGRCAACATRSALRPTRRAI